MIPSSLHLGRDFSWGFMTEFTVLPGANGQAHLHSAFITWTPAQATQNMAAQVFKASRIVSPSRRMQLIPGSLHCDRSHPDDLPFDAFSESFSLSSVGSTLSSP